MSLAGAVVASWSLYTEVASSNHLFEIHLGETQIGVDYNENCK